MLIVIVIHLEVTSVCVGVVGRWVQVVVKYLNCASCCNIYISIGKQFLEQLAVGAGYHVFRVGVVQLCDEFSEPRRVVQCVQLFICRVPRWTASDTERFSLGDV